MASVLAEALAWMELRGRDITGAGAVFCNPTRLFRAQVTNAALCNLLMLRLNASDFADGRSLLFRTLTQAKRH